MVFSFFILKIERNGHFGYPVLSNVAMDLLFDGLKSDTDQQTLMLKED